MILMMTMWDNVYFMPQACHVKNQFKYVVCQFYNFMSQVTVSVVYLQFIVTIKCISDLYLWLQGYTLSSYTLHKDLNMEDIQTVTKEPRLDHALTIYPVQEPHVLFQLHTYFSVVSNLNNVMIDKNVL
jgi:hypothetical protein